LGKSNKYSNLQVYLAAMNSGQCAAKRTRAFPADTYPFSSPDSKPMHTKHVKVDTNGQIQESTFEEARKAHSIPLQV
jgi:hypothetical protein